MENTDLYAMPSSPSFFHLLESEEDFPFGAKTTSFLPPATITNAAATTTTTTTTATYDLPEWMEGRDILGLPDMFESLPLPLHVSTSQRGSLMQLDEDDFCPAIKPEDMLVPLSELQPPHTPASPPLALTPPATPRALTPPATPPRALTPPATPPLVPTPHASPVSLVPIPAPSPADPPIPKIIICRKVTTSTPKSKPIQVNFQVMPVKQTPQITYGTPLLLQPAPYVPNLQSGKNHEGQVAVLPINNTALAQSQNAPSVPAPETCDAEELINEMVQMISSSSTGGFQGLENVSFDASAMEASMEDLLSQLESSDSVTTSLEPSSSSSLLPEFSSSVCVASPHPSESSSPVSPASLSVSLPSQSPSASVPSPHPSESISLASPAYLPSPVPSVGSLSPAQSFCGEANPDDMECLEEEWSPLEETHSYSRSPRKAKSSRRTSGARKTPYPENRKERKKEQNKQAALRYRQKKKQEDDDLTGKIEIEEERQEKLKAKYSGLKQELSYLKKIMREVFMARGLLSEEALKKAALEKKKGSK